MSGRSEGSWSEDDADKPRWDRDTTPEAEYVYRHADGRYAYTILKGRRLDLDKAFLTGRAYQGALDMLELERRENPDQFYKLPGLELYEKGQGDEPNLLYLLPELIAAGAERPDEWVFLCEGEKDVGTLTSLGLIATTNPNGAKRWDDAFNPYFKGRRVVILLDKDSVGRARGTKLGMKLKKIAARVVLLSLQGLRDKEDVTDWLEAGRTKGDLLAAVEKAAERGSGSSADDDGEAASSHASGGTGGPAADNSEGDEPISQVVMARAWSDRYAHSRRHDHTRGQWMVAGQSDGVWRADESRAVFHEIGGIVHEIGGGVARYSNAGFIRGTETLAAALPGVAVTHDAFNHDPLILGTPDGPVDLRTGQLLPPDPSLLISKSTIVAPRPGGAPRWREFLTQSTGGNADMIEFLQRVWGYMLTGLTIEQALFFIYGDGGNGKGVFINVGRRIMGDYAVTSAMETFTVSRNDRHSTELAMLRGARAVLASETEKGKKWAESRIKQLTGNDEITARFMRQDNFTFTPEFKLFIIGNFHPALDTVDDAMRRRFNIIPFTCKPTVVNPRLEEELEAEFPQILAWMIEGCVKWQATGLQRPQAVVDATADYFEEQDLFGQWLDEFCTLDPGQRAATNDLFHSWFQFADEAREDAGSIKSFGNMLTKRGFVPGRETGGKRLRFWKGLKLQTVIDPQTRMERVKTIRDAVGEAM